jgi:BCD family chlorophyll transporter-like MFS transporter
MTKFKSVIRIIQLTLPKIGIGWMFAVLTTNFSRIAINELGIAAVVVTSMIGLYHFLSPFEMVFGKLADQHPVFGFRRTPYLLLGTLISSLVFLALPTVVRGMATGSLLWIAAGFGLLIIFGLGMAMSGNAHLALIADATTKAARGIAVALVWTVMIASLIVSGVVMKKVMPTYTPESMQSLYDLTPLVAMASVLLAVIFVERRLSATEQAEAIAASCKHVPHGNMIRVASQLLSGSKVVRYFFTFVFLSTIGVFMQDTILTVFGAKVLGMSLKETTLFQPIWGSGVLAAMLIAGGVTTKFPHIRKTLGFIGNVGTTAGLLLLAFASLSINPKFVTPALITMGVFTGLHTLGSLTTMMELTHDEARATYMGLWGLAMALGSGVSGILAGSMVSLLVETAWLSPSMGYAVIFAFEGLLMAIGAISLRKVDVLGFHQTKPIATPEAASVQRHEEVLISQDH